ncbi:MAG: Crp/Fnr family transcriptional regulator [Sphingobacterium sp.]
MHSKLIDHFRKYTTFDQAEDSEILSYFEYKSYLKKEIIQEEGAPCMHHFFVLEGCLRQFFLSENGVQHTTQFAIENWWITDYMAFATQSPAAFSLQAVEPTQVLCISQQNQRKLFSEHPQMERYFRSIYQRAYAALQLRTKYLYELSRADFYHHFNDRFPDFTERIPQQMLASYLNMTPEYLSEIKGKLKT